MLVKKCKIYPALNNCLKVTAIAKDEIGLDEHLGHTHTHTQKSFLEFVIWAKNKRIINAVFIDFNIVLSCSLETSLTFSYNTSALLITI